MKQSTSGISQAFETTKLPFVKDDGAKGTVFEGGPATLSGAVTYYSAIDTRTGGDRVNGSRVIYQLSMRSGKNSPCVFSFFPYQHATRLGFINATAVDGKYGILF